MSVNEQPLLFSPSLAMTIGLNEAILIQFLQHSSVLSAGQFVLTYEVQKAFFGFWDIEQTHQTLISLQTLGLVSISQSQGGKWEGCVLLSGKTQSEQAPVTSHSQRHDSKPVEPSGIIESVRSPIEGGELEQTIASDAENEARRYNQGRGNPLGHLHQPKATPIYSQNTQSSHALSRMDSTWQPSEKFHEMLRLHNIPIQFANEQLPVFKQYYIDSGKTAMSWDSRFINWVQRAKASARSFEGQYEKNNRSNPDAGLNAKQRKEEVRQKLRDISDTSWAD